MDPMVSHYNREGLKIDIHRVLLVLLEAKEPLSQGQIGDILEISSRAIGENIYLEKILNSYLGPFLKCRDGTVGEYKYEVFHQSLSDWLRSKEGDTTYHCNSADSHRYLGSVSLLKSPSMSLYAYKYGVQHLCEEYQSRGTDDAH